MPSIHLEDVALLLVATIGSQRLVVWTSPPFTNTVDTVVDSWPLTWPTFRGRRSPFVGADFCSIRWVSALYSGSISQCQVVVEDMRGCGLY